ncbi:SpoIIE family protein phosphatase [bacterium]|nr:SpoIIE family protein phosphatase [bacterium]
MDYKHFKTICSVRIIAITATACLLAFSYFRESNFAILIAIGTAILYQVRNLIYYVQKTNRDLTRFLDAVKYEDFSQTFTGGTPGSSFNELAEAFSGVMAEIKKARSKTEEHYRYLQTIVQHVGVGMISFKENGEVELFNHMAKRLFNIDQLKNLQGLNRFKPGLAEELLLLSAGAQSLITLEKPVHMQLSIRATQFIMQGEKYTLISIHNIETELERERMSKELEIAHQVQINLLPKTSPALRGVSIAGACIPAREVGGDYFDYIELGPDKMGIAIGDVSGKGLPAAIYMTLTKGVLQSEAADQVSPKAVMTKVNRLMYQSISRDTFVSMFYAVLDMRAGTFTYARAGHNPPIFFKASESRCSFLDAPGIGLGLDSGARFQDNVTESTINVSPGDWIICYTDGITEAMDSEMNEFGEERLLEVVRTPHSSPEAMLRAIHEAVDKFTGNGQAHDDMTLIAIQITGIK